MEIDDFIKKIKELSPDLEILTQRGYSERMSLKIVKRFEIRQKNNMVKTIGILDDFINNYQIEGLQINKISFSDELETFGEYFSVAFMEGGYLVTKTKDSSIYSLYADDFGSEQLFCNNEEDFFKLLLIFAEFSGKVFNGKIDPFDKVIREKYLDKCNEISSTIDFDIFL